MPMFRTTLDRKFFAEGVNDTIFRRERRPGQARTQRNFQVLPEDGSFKIIKGRLSVKDDYASNLTAIFSPPAKIVLRRFKNDDNSLSLYWNSAEYVATIAAGNYYTRAELGAALQTAINAEIGAAAVAVTMVDSGRKIRITNNSGHVLIVRWFHEDTTLAPSIFGWNYSVSIADSSYAESTFRLANNPPAGGTKKLVVLEDALVDEDGTELKSPEGVSMSASSQRSAGAWNLNKLYFCNGLDNYIVRDEYLKRLPRNSDNPTITNSSSPAAGTGTNQTTHNADNMYLDGTRRVALLKRDNAGAHMQFEKLRLWMGRDNYDWDFQIRVYNYFPLLNIKEYITTLSQNDVGKITSAPMTGSAEVVMDDVDYFGYSGGYILLEYDPGANAYPSYKILFLGTTSGAPACYYTDSNGIPTLQSNWTPYMIEEMISAASGGYTGLTLSNIDGFETELDDWEGRPFKSEPTFADVAEDIDYDRLNIYKSIAGVSADEAVFYLQLSIPAAYVRYFQIELAASFQVQLGHDDTWLAAQDDADMSSRSARLLFKQVFWFDGYLWAYGDPAYPNRIFWCDEQDEMPAPEKWAVASRNISFGSSGEAITGAAAGLDRLIVFKENSFCFVALSGDSYAIIDTSDDGVGTKTGYSCVHVFSNQGSMFFFQGADGHFYATDGVKLYYLSKGNEWGEGARLAQFVKTLNMAALDKTFAIFDPNNQEIKWSVCTGANTTPNVTVIYSIPQDHFYFQDAAADFWTYDKINDSYPGQTLILGFHGKETFYDRMADDDLGVVLTAEYRNDWDLGDDNTDKIWHKAHVWCGSEETDQQVLVEVYLDDSDTAASSSPVDLEDPPARKELGIDGMSERLGLAFKCTASYPGLGARIGRVVIEGSKQEALVL